MIAPSVDLSGANTLGLPSRADAVRVITDTAALAAAAEAARAAGQPLTVLGGGSNVVLRDRIPGLVCLMRTRGVSETPSGDSVLVTAAAGERWHDLVRRTLGRGLYGLENLALIPGAVGAAPIQNIGAYGVELSDRFVSLRAMDVDSGSLRTFDRADCRFGYRDSVFKSGEQGRWIIVEVTLALSRRPAPVIDYPDLLLELERLGWQAPSPVRVAEAVIRVRRRKLPDPRWTGNAGSFFKNPVVPADVGRRLAAAHGLTVRAGEGGAAKLSAAQLIDRCGWKGRSAGLAAVWSRQPLVLVNTGAARARDILALAEHVRADVHRRFGVELELEPRVIGQD